MSLRPYYSEPGITIYHGDCREVMPKLEAVDLVLTDPPYGIDILNSDGTMGGTSKDLNMWRGPINPVYMDFHGDDQPIDPAMLLKVSKDQIIWGGNYIADKLPASKCWLVWYKRINGQQNNFADCELAWTSFDKPARVFQHLWMGMLRDSEQQVHHHPTQKPLALMEWCIRETEAKTILDAYMGSGTVLRAAKNLGRKAIGIEIEEKYCEIAVRRLAQEVLPLDWGNK